MGRRSMFVVVGDKAKDQVIDRSPCGRAPGAHHAPQGPMTAVTYAAVLSAPYTPPVTAAPYTGAPSTPPPSRPGTRRTLPLAAGSSQPTTDPSPPTELPTPPVTATPPDPPYTAVLSAPPPSRRSTGRALPLTAGSSPPYTDPPDATQPLPSPTSCPAHCSSCVSPPVEQREDQDECMRGAECSFRWENRCRDFHPDQREHELNRNNELSDTEKQLLQQFVAHLHCISAPIRLSHRSTPTLNVKRDQKLANL